MKFIGIWEYDIITEEVQKKSAEILELRKKHPEKYPKKLRHDDGSTVEYGLWIGGMKKGFSLYETDDVSQLQNLGQFWAPDLIFKFIPLVKAGEQ
jgi:hypothetical protein